MAQVREVWIDGSTGVRTVVSGRLPVEPQPGGGDGEYGWTWEEGFGD